MRRICYPVACSLHGYIADPGGGYAWIVPDAAIDVAAPRQQFDTLLPGRHTDETVVRSPRLRGPQASPSGIALLEYDVQA